MNDIKYRLTRDPEPDVTATGEHWYATDEKGRVFVMTPRRRKVFVCDAGVEHRTYWRSVGSTARKRSHFACEHNSITS